jgi:hypothetical protein
MVNPLDSQHYSPSPVIQEAHKPQLGLAGEMAESELPSTSLDIQQSERSSSPELNDFSDLSYQPQSDTSRDQVPMPARSHTPIDNSGSADPGCREHDGNSGEEAEDLGRTEVTRETYNFDFDELSELVQLDDIKTTTEFMLKTASLDDEAMRLDSECLKRL